MLVIGLGFFLYMGQRQQHIQSELQKLQESTRVAAGQISNELKQIHKEFEYLSELNSFTNFFSAPIPISKSITNTFERSFSRFDKVLRGVYIFSSQSNIRFCRVSDDGILDFLPTNGFKPINLPVTVGLHLIGESLYFVAQSPAENRPGVCFELNCEGLMSKNLISVGKLRQSLRLLLSDEAITLQRAVEFPCFDEKIPYLILIETPEQLKQSVSNRNDFLTTVSTRLKEKTENFFLLSSPVTFYQQKINLVLLLKRDNVLDLVNANHFIFMSFFAFAMIFSLMLLILRFTLNTQNSISEELAAQSNLFSLIINSMPIGVAVKDIKDENRYIICNLAAAHIFNQPVSNIVGHRDEEIFSPEMVCEHRTQDKHVEQTHDTEIIEKEVANYGAGGLWLRTTRLPLFSADGEMTMLMRVVEDITTSVKLESQLHHSQRMDEIGKLAGGIAHEFNNLLQVILGYCEFIKAETDNEMVTQNLEQIEKAGRSAMRLTRQLLTYSRKTEMKKEPVELSKVITDGLRMLTRFIGDGIEISFNQASEPITIIADSAQIEQILVNLCVNARDAMNGKGKITISVDKVTEVHEAINLGIRRNQKMQFGHIRVADNGPGLPENLRERIFEPFFTTKEVGKGTGLGLAIVYAIMKQHEGYIFIDKNTVTGTAFDIYLPILIETVKEEAALIEVKTEKTFDASRHLVLVAEDEEAVRLMCIKLLRKNGFSILEATNGEEAVELFQQNSDKVSLMVFDVMMPKMTGKTAYDTIARIRPGIPTIFCTGYSDENLKAELTENPNVILLDKPYKTTKLIESIKTLLS